MDAATAIRTADARTAAPQPSAPFAAVIVHEDPASSARARAVLERMAAEWGAPSCPACTLWPFHQLQDSAARDQAAAEASRADVVLVAARLSSQLPAPVKNWIWTWLPLRPVRAGTLGLTFEDCVRCEEATDRPESPLCAALRRAAALGHMDFVCSRSQWRCSSDVAYLRRLLERAHKTSTVLEGILSRRGIPHWGLNE